MYNVTTHEHEKPEYILLYPTHVPARGPDDTYQQIITIHDLETVISFCMESDFTAVDFETEGAEYQTGIRAIGLGLAWNIGSIYLHLADLTEEQYDWVFQQLLLIPRLIAHNVYFDGGVLLQNAGKHGQWHTCTYQAVATLANDSIEIRWGLKECMTSLLLWESNNTEELDLWLINNGHTKGLMPKDVLTVGIRECYLTNRIKPEYSKMHLAPASILGKYCILDAEATYLLYTQILLPGIEYFQGVQPYLQDLLAVTLISIEQKILGLPINREQAAIRLSKIAGESDILEFKFLTHPTTQKHIEDLEYLKLEEHMTAMPIQLKKNGEVSKNYTKWLNKTAEIKDRKHPEYLFNIQSPLQLSELLYERMKFPIVERTESGQPAVSNKTYAVFGELGEILQARADLVKEHTYLNVYLEMSEKTGSIHPSFRIPGTITGRMSGKDPNLQQMPKTKVVMNLFEAPKGKTWIDLDFTALEPVMTTELSACPNMLSIYGPHAKKNDLYLFIGAHIPGIGDKIRNTGYDPYNPTAEALARAKKECKTERSISKTLALGSVYGAGAAKLQSSLALSGVNLSLETVKEIHASYWHIFAKVKDYSKSLEYEHRRNKGYVLNYFGRPMAVTEDYKKDIMNRVVQSSGHDLLLKYICIYTSKINMEGIWWRPLIIDFHDASAIEVFDRDARRAAEIMTESLEELHRIVKPKLVKFGGSPDMGSTLTAIKGPES